VKKNHSGVFAGSGRDRYGPVQLDIAVFESHFAARKTGRIRCDRRRRDENDSEADSNQYATHA